MTRMHSSALEYAARGWAVFPLGPGTKKPMKNSHGFKDATTDGGIIQRWWTETPDANVGIATGRVSRIFVVDVDVSHGDDGFRSLANLEKQNEALPATYAAQTPGNGRHLYFQLTGVHIASSVDELGPGLDVRGDGGYVVAPPSVVGERPYEVINPAPLAPPPSWLLDQLCSPQVLCSDAEAQANCLYPTSLHPCIPACLHNNMPTSLHISPTDPNSQRILANITARTQALDALKADRPVLAKLYVELVEGRFQAHPGARNAFVTHAVPFLYRAVTPRLVLVLVGCFYDCNRTLFKDSRDDHMKEAKAMLASVTQTYRDSLHGLERQIYEALDDQSQDAFRICRDLARLPGREGELLTFFMSFEQLGARLDTFPIRAQRIMMRFEEHGLLKLVEKGTKRAAGVRGKAGTYRWLVETPTGQAKA